MTPAPTIFDYDLLQEVRKLVLKTAENQVCKWEQQSHDALLQDDFRAAGQYKDWAFAGNCIRHEIALKLGALILEAIERAPSPVVYDHHAVQLPNFNRTPKDQALDVLATEVVSEAPEPC
jgi:hypothetical protein